ncbi:MAG: hypothetical protein JO267_06845 [Alphaproteobacteria bacterium]|nr:hypothetical protein [Alphaproteobacteria bacterium]MBV9861848.1 hypothetical protein [Alphaproteobacteria bacterium]
MAATKVGLPNNGQTAHYDISYDSTLPNGMALAAGLIAACEQDFALMKDWFGGIDLIYSYPIPVLIANATGGASWQTPTGAEVAFGWSPPVTVNANNPNAAPPGLTDQPTYIRFLLVAEMTEMFMASKDNGWFVSSGLFDSGDEGSKGEGLSRFLAVQFLLATGLGTLPPSNARATQLWLNGGRPDAVSSAPDDHELNVTTGCTTAFIWYLSAQLGYGINAIINSGADTLAGVYQKLTGRPDAWTAFSTLVNTYYPPGSAYNPLGDNIFPVPNLSQFFAPNQITTGHGGMTLILIDRPALAEANIQLTTDDPTIVAPYPATVTVPVGQTSTAVTFISAPFDGPFPTKTVNCHASYAGRTLTVPVEIVPPRVIGVTLTPDTVVSGDIAQCTVTLDNTSVSGPVSVNLLSDAPGFATVPNPIATLAPFQTVSPSVAIDTPDIEIPFKTAHADILATYGDSSASARLTVKSRVVAGILNTLTVRPDTVTGGRSATGTVTLAEAVSVDTVVGLAAQEPGGGGLPMPWNNSSVASVPTSITIHTGNITGTFQISTTRNLSPGTRRPVRIMAGAVVTLYATLTVTT